MKLKYILPVATIASVATAVTPLAVSCSANGIALDVKDGDALRSKDKYDIEKDKVYTLVIKTSQLKELGDARAYHIDSEIPNTQVDINTAGVTIGSKKLKYVEKWEQMDAESEFSIDGNDGIVIKAGAINLGDKITVKLSFPTEGKGCYFYIELED